MFSVWTRAGMQNEGAFKFPDGTLNLESELLGYPIMLSQFTKIRKSFIRKGLTHEGNTMLVWVHSLRALLYKEELRIEANYMWKKILSSKNLWGELFTEIEESNPDIDHALRVATMKLCLEIFVEVEDNYVPFIK